MAYNRHIDKTEEELRKLREVYAQDDIDRFLDGLEAGRINTEAQVIEITNKINENDGLARLEYKRLEAFKVGFIEAYATNYNKRFTTAHLLMNRMRSGISRGLKMLEYFSEKQRRKGCSKKNRKVIDNSKMGKCAYRRSFYGLEQYKESVNALHKAIANYMNDLTKCINLCLYMIDQVKAVRADPDWASEIYDNCHKETVMNQRTTIKRFIKLNVDMENDILERMESCQRQKEKVKKLKAVLYHTLDVNEWNDLCICEEVMVARSQGVTNEERALWGDDKLQVMRVRTVIEHLDELFPEGKKNISGEFLARLFSWCNILPNRGLHYLYSYFYTNYMMHGRLKPRGEQAVKMAKAKIAKLDFDEDKKLREEFNQKLECLVKKYMVYPSKSTDKEDAAVNF